MNEKQLSENEAAAEHAAGELWAVPAEKQKYLASVGCCFMSEVVNDPFITEDRKQHYQRLYYLFTVISHVKPPEKCLNCKL